MHFVCSGKNYNSFKYTEFILNIQIFREAIRQLILKRKTQWCTVNNTLWQFTLWSYYLCNSAKVSESLSYVLHKYWKCKLSFLLGQLLSFLCYFLNLVCEWALLLCSAFPFCWICGSVSPRTLSHSMEICPHFLLCNKANPRKPQTLLYWWMWSR